jgi:CHAT domain-containing protein
VVDGEGVMGLRRAFALAGTRSLLMSLWAVGDLETRRLMENFYTRIVSDPSIDKAEALRQTKLHIINQYRRDKGQAHQHMWAAFILSGI